MSTKVPLLTSAAGIRHDWIQDADSWRLSSTQDVTSILDLNKAMANENDGYTPSRDLRRVASIPFIIQQKWLNEEGWDCFDPEHSDKLVQKLNDPDWAHLRTASGRMALTNGVIR